MKIAAMGLTVLLALCGAASAEMEPKDAGMDEKLKTEYKVDEARIESLRAKSLGYGEIKNVLAIAEKMPGGISDANVDKIMALRQGPPVMGWGEIAKKQGVTLGSVVGKGAEKKAEKASKPGKPEKAVRPEKPSRPERPGKAEHGKR